MSFFKWTEALAVWVEPMDDEHKELVDLMNQLHIVSTHLRPKIEIETALTALLRFTEKHFLDEEAFMASIHYPDLERHKRAHTDLLSRLASEERRFRTSERTSLEEGFFSFLQFWLKTHIQANDVKYGFYSRRHL